MRRVPAIGGRRVGTVAALIVLLLFMALAGPDAAAQTYVWWEGEEFAETNLPDPSQPFPGNISAEEKARLSGGRWLLTQGPESDTPYTITYRVEVPRTDTYNFWVRKFWKHGPFQWRFDNQEWRECGRDIALHGDTYLRKFIGANWVFLGEVELDAGTRTLHVEMLDEKGGGAIDCFILIDGAFAPRGKLKPGETSGQSEPGFFAWEPDADPLSDDCPIDLSYLNEDEAGRDGFARREGNGFVLGSGKPVRFWMVQGGGLLSMKPQMADYWARRLAKYGVNLVRLGNMGRLRSFLDGDEEAFREQLDRLHYLVSALKREGIYVYLGHLWWHTSVDVEGAFGALYFDPEVRNRFLEFVDAMMGTRNPYTGLPMGKDPAVAFVEVQNESSLFFWTFRPERMSEENRQRMEKRFAQWAAKKYGSVQAALKAWGPEKSPSQFVNQSQDQPEQGRLALYGVGNLTVNDWAAGQRNPTRAGDQLQFMTEFQRAFYADMIGRWRDLSVQNMITCSNWKTADPRNLGVLERYLYTAGDAVCRNVYFDVEYDPKPERFYAIDLGDTFNDYSALKPPRFPAPLTVPHIIDHPDMYTENNWCRPNRYRVEWPFLVATYAQMMGMDGWTFFSLDTPLWNSQMNVWEVNCPSVLGQFPGAALIFRRGDVREAPTAVTQRMSLQHLYDFGQAALFELTGRDALWVSKIGDLEGAAAEAAMQVDRLAFFVGKVNRVIADGPEAIQSVNLDEYIDRDAKTVRAMTGELDWDYGKGVVTVNTPRAQGACGFLKDAGRIELRDVVIEPGNDYGSVLVVSLDGKSLAESERVLIQTGTQDHPYGFETKPVNGKKRISDLGGYPMNVKRVNATVTLRGRGSLQATVLDGNGYPTDRKASTSAADGGKTIELPEDSLYTLVEPGESGNTVHILPLGDSITQGGRTDRPEYTYRLPLFQKLTDAGVDFDFIGSLDTGLHRNFKWPDYEGIPFDRDHEGHYGWKTAKVRDNLAEWMKTYPAPADIVLIHLGTNDQGADDHAQAVAEPLRDIIQMLREANPRVVVLVGHLNFNGGAALKIRPLVEQMAREMNTDQSPVVTVNHYEGWTARPDAPDTDTFDWAHPNPQGQEKMAEKWFAAMKPYLDRFE